MAGTMRGFGGAVLLALALAAWGCGGGDGAADPGGPADALPIDPGTADLPAGDPGAPRDPGAPADPGGEGGPGDEGPGDLPAADATPDEGPADPGPGDPGPADPGVADPGAPDPGAADPGPADPGPGTKQAGESCTDYPECANGMSCIAGQFTRAHCNPLCTTVKECTDAAPGSNAQCMAIGGYQVCIWYCGAWGGGAACPGDLTCDGATCG